MARKKKRGRGFADKRWLLLDKDDCTRICSSMSQEEVLRYFDYDSKKLAAFLKKPDVIFLKKYYLVEDI